jgi:hypothetical protein
MARLTLSSELTQGTPSAETLAWTASAGVTTTITGTGLPAIAAGELFEIRDHSVAVNNGLYVESGGSPLTTSVTADKVSGANPSNETSEAITWLGDSNTLAKNVFFDTAARGIYLLEQEGLGFEGVEFNAWYKFTKEEFKDDNFLKAFPFPVFAIDLDAGKYQVGTDGANPNGWVFVDDSGNSIRTRKLLRAGGWLESNAAGNTLRIYPNITTLGTFEAPTTDVAYYMFGTDTTLDNTVDYDFAGAVDEAILAFEEIGNPATFTYVDGAGGDDTVTRVSGSFITDGFVVGGSMKTRASNTPANDGTYVITAVAALTLTFDTGSFNLGEADAVAQVAVDNRTSFTTRIRVRDGDTNGKFFDTAVLADAGILTLNNLVAKFPLGNATDLNITETDANIDGNTPYTNMSITYYATPQSIAGYVGGSFNFGIEIDAATGTAIEVYEFVQRQLRLLTDIDSDADTAIGRAMDDLLVFEGNILVSGLAIPTNPDGGGSGVYISNIAAADQNNIRNVDNTGARKQFPETVSVTLDFNQALIDDTVAEYTLWFDRTIRNAVDVTFVVTAGTGSAGTFVSTTQFPAALDAGVGAYVRVVGLTGVDAAMNGVYQVTALTSTSLWSVERYDGKTIVTTTGAVASIDEHPIDSPDSLIVDSDVPAAVTGLSSADFNFAFDFDANVQGGRVVSTETFVVGRAIGLATSQFVQSSVQSIATATPLTIVLTASGELNVV